MAILNYEYDPRLVSPEVCQLLNQLFEKSDEPGSEAAWTECFSDDAAIWRNGKASNGRSEIESMIANSWINVASRDHRPSKVFAAGMGSSDVMVDGTTLYNWQDGTSKTGVWSCKISFKEVDGSLKISNYHVVFF